MRRVIMAALLLAAAPAVRLAAADGASGPEPGPAPSPPAAQEASKSTDEPKPRMDVYGFAMLDMGYQFNQNDPDWFDVVRPTKLPAYPNEYGEDGRYFASVRQSRFGVKGFIPTGAGEVKTIFEWELFGVGVDAGQTTLRLRHAWGELGQVGAGQYWSPFMDIDVFPNSIEYWGPNAMVFFRNVQLRWTPWREGDSRVAIALERPGASGDRGRYDESIPLQGIQTRFPLPDLSAHFRYSKDWGHVQVAGILRRIQWDDLTDDEFELGGQTTGWGINVTSNIKLSRHLARLAFVYGEGIENYMNDASVDIGVHENFGNPVTPLVGRPLPLLGLVAFLDLNWSEEWTSTVGYSYMGIDNTSGMSDEAYKTGQYALANILYHPASNVFLGPEVQWGKRENFRGGFTSDDFRIQFSAKYSFDMSFGGK